LQQLQSFQAAFVPHGSLCSRTSFAFRSAFFLAAAVILPGRSSCRMPGHQGPDPEEGLPQDILDPR